MIYKSVITLNQNNRGCYILDTVKGCSYAGRNPSGCYGDCYAANIANRYGFDFDKPVKRYFIEDDIQLFFEGYHDTSHEAKIINQIKDAPFVRIGEMGDPSEYWEHTLAVCEKISIAGKPIVIITKHWKTIPDGLLHKLDKYNIIINTSISALDSKAQIKHRLEQYNKLKEYCKSVLRVVTCDFNLKDDAGKKMNEKQNKLLQNDNVIETVFRPSAKNELVKYEVINVINKKFLNGNILFSMRDEHTFTGHCSNCKEQCGINL